MKNNAQIKSTQNVFLQWSSPSLAYLLISLQAVWHDDATAQQDLESSNQAFVLVI